MATAADKKIVKSYESNLEKMKKCYKTDKKWFGMKVTKKMIEEGEKALKTMKASLKK
ncbi:MAG TPA: hypothetical protein VN026_09665 [Bacteroidia bacterium]|jgi:hypothetical protein|nr:hypothetical protein [Bacteroidia bacterium]